MYIGQKFQGIQQKTTMEEGTKNKVRLGFKVGSLDK
jgi:hypothetical protein